MRLHHLTLGSTFEELLVQIYRIDGNSTSVAVVRDGSAFARFVSRNDTSEAWQEGSWLSISGRVSCSWGYLQLQGSCTKAPDSATIQQSVTSLPYSPAVDISAHLHHFGVVLIHHGTNEATGNSQTSFCLSKNSALLGCPFPTTSPTLNECGQEAACRAVQEVGKITPDQFCLLHSSSSVTSVQGHVVHLFAAIMLTNEVSVASSSDCNSRCLWRSLDDIRCDYGMSMWHGCIEATNQAASFGQAEAPVPSTALFDTTDTRMAVSIISGLPDSGRKNVLSRIWTEAQSAAAEGKGPRCAALVSATDRAGGFLCSNFRVDGDVFFLGDDEDLDEALGRISELGLYQCVLVDNSRQDSPSQLAEDLATAGEDDMGGLQARLDVCVAVVDAATLVRDLQSRQTLAQCMMDSGHHLDDSDDRLVVDVVLSQVEFANVIMMSNVEAVSQVRAAELQKLLNALNPGALVLKLSSPGAGPTTSALLAPHVITTGRFNSERMLANAGWLQALQSPLASSSTSTWVFRARRPFNPERLHRFLLQNFALEQPNEWANETEEEHHDHSNHDHDHCHDHHDHCHDHHDHSHSHDDHDHSKCCHGQPSDEGHHHGPDQHNHHSPLTTQSKKGVPSSGVASLRTAAQSMANEAQRMALLLTKDVSPAVAAAAASLAAAAATTAAAAVVAATQTQEYGRSPSQVRESAFGLVIRSKGFAWLAGAGRHDHCGDWSQAGDTLRFSSGGPWYCVLPREDWPSEPDKVADIERDLQGDLGDRRQELAFIGLDLNKKALEAALTDCLCTDEEINLKLHDPFDEWPDIQEMMNEVHYHDGEDSESTSSEETEESCDEGEEEEEEEEEEAPEWQPGKIFELSEGASELQALLDSVPHGSAVLVDWHAPWARACQKDVPFIEKLAARLPTALIVRLDVEASYANAMLAREKVMGRPISARESNRPTLKNGQKWPCYTLHRSPILQPLQQLCDNGALQSAADELTRLAAEGPQPEPKAKSLQSRPEPVLNPAVGHGSKQIASTEKLVQQLKRGATDLKQQLQESQVKGLPVAVVWVGGGHHEVQSDATLESSTSDPNAGLFESLRETAEDYASSLGGIVGSPLFLVADVNASVANTNLAAALKVEILPVFHVYHDMKMVKSFKGEDALTKLQSAMSELLQSKIAAVAASDQAPTKKKKPPSKKKESAPEAEASNMKATPVVAAAPSVWDPPTGKEAKAGYERMFAGVGKGIFWPKMPCLRCGCPWWQGEDWDARCLRCGWDCEFDGYDDDSQPVPKFKGKFDAFVAILKSGRVPEWTGKTATGPRKPKTAKKV